VGAPWHDHGGVQTGSVYVYRRLAGGFALETELIGSDSLAFDWFGASVSAVGDRIAVGAPLENGFGSDSGAVYVFVHDGAQWSEEAKLQAPGASAGERYGQSVSLDGDRMLTSAPRRDGAGTLRGAAWVYRFESGLGWSLETELPWAGKDDGDYFGHAVALRGSLAAVSAPLHAAGGVPRVGQALLYARDPAAGWGLVESLPQGTAAGSHEGWSLALDQEALLVGRERARTGNSEVGLASAYRAAPAPLRYCTHKTSSVGCAPRVDTFGAPSLSGPGTFELSAASVHNATVGFFFYGVAGATSLPFAGGTLCVAAPVRRTAVVSTTGAPPPPVNCTGSTRHDFGTWMRSGADPNLRAGVEVFAQFWFSDPASLGGAGLTDAVRFVICP
jgi:hypothetical protein